MSEKQEKFYNRLLIFISIVIFLCALLGTALSVNAAENSDNFPYALDTYKGTIPDSIIDVVISDFRSASGYSGDNFIIFATDTNWTSIFFKVIIDPCFNKPDNINTYSYSSSYYPIYSYSGMNQYNFWYRPDNGAHGQYGSPTYNSGYDFGGDTTSSIGFYYTFYPHYPIYMGSDYVYNRFDLNASSETIANIGIYKSTLPAVVPTIGTGHASEPENINPIDPDWSPRPTAPNPPTIINHIWGSSPSIDTTSIETLLESIFDILSWFGQNVSDEFNAVISNIVNVGLYIGDLISYFALSVLDSINNLAHFLYDNFLDLFQAFFSSFLNLFKIVSDLYNHGLNEDGEFEFTVLLSYLFIPDSEDVVQILIDNDEFGFIGAIEHLCTVWLGFINTLRSLSQTYYITLPQFTLAGVTCGPYDINFGWYMDYKVIGDGIISAFLILGYLYWLYTRISGILRGSPGSIYDSNKNNKGEGD